MDCIVLTSHLKIIEEEKDKKKDEYVYVLFFVRSNIELNGDV